MMIILIKSGAKEPKEPPKPVVRLFIVILRITLTFSQLQQQRKQTPGQQLPGSRTLQHGELLDNDGGLGLNIVVVGVLLLLLVVVVIVVLVGASSTMMCKLRDGRLSYKRIRTHRGCFLFISPCLKRWLVCIRHVPRFLLLAEVCAWSDWETFGQCSRRHAAT